MVKNLILAQTVSSRPTFPCLRPVEEASLMYAATNLVKLRVDFLFLTSDKLLSQASVVKKTHSDLL